MNRRAPPKDWTHRAHSCYPFLQINFMDKVMSTEDDKLRVEANLKPTPVQVLAQYVKDFSFENPGSPQSLRVSNVAPKTDVNILIDANKLEDEQDLYETAITLKVKSIREDETLFIAEIVYAALVGLKDVPQEYIRPILYVEVPQMLFPFARQLMANAVSAGGFPPLLLNPIDFKSMYENTRKLEGATAAA